MAEIKKKIAALKKKRQSRENKLARLAKRIADSKHESKVVIKEINEIDGEIHQLELQELSEKLAENGITTDDVAAAIAEGSIKKTTPKVETEKGEVSGEVTNGDTYSTENNIKEAKSNEISGS